VEKGFKVKVERATTGEKGEKGRKSVGEWAGRLDTEGGEE